MKIVRYMSVQAAEPRLGVLRGTEIVGNSRYASTLEQVIDGPRSVVEDLTAEVVERADETVPVAEAQLLAPMQHPSSFRDFMAFEKHVVQGSRAAGREISPAWYDAPSFYFSNPHVIHGPYSDVRVPRHTAMFDLELELAAVVGEDGSDLDADAATATIAGYTLLSDWSLRDVQAKERSVGLGPVKAKDGATSLGSVFITPDELAGLERDKGYDVMLSARVNGHELTRGSWADIHWSMGELIAYASQDSRVRAGDLIGSGTVGGGCLLEHASQPFHESTWLSVGDRVELDGGPLGEIRVRLV